MKKLVKKVIRFDLESDLEYDKRSHVIGQVIEVRPSGSVRLLSPTHSELIHFTDIKAGSIKVLYDTEYIDIMDKENFKWCQLNSVKALLSRHEKDFKLWFDPEKFKWGDPVYMNLLIEYSMNSYNIWKPYSDDFWKTAFDGRYFPWNDPDYTCRLPIIFPSGVKRWSKLKAFIYEKSTIRTLEKYCADTETVWRKEIVKRTLRRV